MCRYIAVRLVEVAVPRKSFEAFLKRIDFSKVSIPESLYSRLKESASLYNITQLEKNLDELGQLGEEGMNLEKVLKAYVKNCDMDEMLNILNQMDNLK